MVDGYTSHDEAKRRERDEAIRRENEKRVQDDRARELARGRLKALHQRLKSANVPFDCMIETVDHGGLAMYGDQKPWSKKPGWYLGSETQLSTVHDGYGERTRESTTHYALTKRGKLYANHFGVGGRKQFQTVNQLKSPPGEIVELLEARLAELA